MDMEIVPGWSLKFASSVNAILSSADRENLPVLNPGPGVYVDKTSVTWFRFYMIFRRRSQIFFEKDGFMSGRHTASSPLILRTAGFLYSL